MNASALIKEIRVWLGFFIAGLILAGLTAFPLQTELDLLCSWSGVGDATGPEGHEGIAYWFLLVREGLRETSIKYPFLAYGTDWLAFAHLVIAVFFIGPWRDPVRNIWVIEAGMTACVMVIPLAFICGMVRDIPVYWRLIDCSFGILGIIPLWIVHRKISRLALLK